MTRCIRLRLHTTSGNATRSIRVLLHKLTTTWRVAQVELTGKYSIERILDLTLYTQLARPLRVFYLFVLTIAPCLVAIMILEAVPLAPIELDIEGSRNFWYRTFFGTYMVTHSLVAQYRHNIATLVLSAKQTVVISFVTAVLLLDHVLDMPHVWLPATILRRAVDASMVAYRDHDRWVHAARPVDARSDHSHSTQEVHDRVPIIMYPASSYIFNSYPQSQTAMALLLSMIKLLFKNWFGYLSHHIEDIKPELVVFHVEIFSALYVSACMQNATSVSTTLVIMAVDFVQACLSIKDLNDVLDDKNLRRALGTDTDCCVLVPLATHILQANPGLWRDSSIRVKSSAPNMRRPTPGGSRPTRSLSHRYPS